jgi:hypothetical protein
MVWIKIRHPPVIFPLQRTRSQFNPTLKGSKMNFNMKFFIYLEKVRNKKYKKKINTKAKIFFRQS